MSSLTGEFKLSKVRLEMTDRVPGYSGCTWEGIKTLSCAARELGTEESRLSWRKATLAQHRCLVVKEVRQKNKNKKKDVEMHQGSC